MPSKTGRHTPAFLLLFLADSPSHGAGLLARMRAELPFFLSDSAGLYRALQNLEQTGAVSCHWDTPASGAPRKVYTITPSGRALLGEMAEDIRRRFQNFQFFLLHFDAISKESPNEE